MTKRYKRPRISRVVDNKIVIKIKYSLTLRQREVIKIRSTFFSNEFQISALCYDRLIYSCSLLKIKILSHKKPK